MNRSTCARIIALHWEHNAFADMVSDARWSRTEEGDFSFSITFDRKGPRIPFNLDVMIQGFNQAFGTDITVEEVSVFLVFS